jgi:septum formation protein
MTCPRGGSITASSKTSGAGLRLILGSASPRRLELLAQLGLTPAAIRPADIAEDPLPRETPLAYVSRLAREKSLAVAIGTDEVLLTADTTVALGRRTLGKPADEAEAAAFLFALSGRRHRVITAIAVRHGDTLRLRTSETAVRVKRLSDSEVNGYLASGEWRGKAGGYAIQGLFAAFVPWLQGSYSGVMGLPLHETAHLLAAAGIAAGTDAR